MRIIKLDATGSTNATLKELWQNGHAPDWTVLRADNQTAGRGQQGTSWISEPGKNLTFSILKKFDSLEALHQFLLNMAVSLAVNDTLKEMQTPELQVKWPNDIMSGSNKICGILIENIVKSNYIQAAVIGLGLNINQQDFGEVTGATSLKNINGKDCDIEEVFSLLIESLKLRLDRLTSDNYEDVRSEYESVLYRKDSLSRLSIDGMETQLGMIRGISKEGKLLVEFDGTTSAFNMKEIQLLD